MSKYIVLEGLDGSGKSTQAELLYEYIKLTNPKVILTQEPGSKLNAFNLRDILCSAKEVSPVALELLFQADRAEHTRHIKKLLSEGYTVISDRSFLTGLAYARANKGRDSLDLEGLVNMAIQCYPSKVIFVDTPVKTCLNRIYSRGKSLTREEAQGEQHLNNIRDNFIVVILFPSPSKICKS